jgi:AcrR family transcriptional regulator
VTDTKAFFEQLMPEFFSDHLSKGNQTKLRILKGAIDCFATIGVEGTSYQTIAQASGVSKQLVNRYFPSKDELFISAIVFVRANFQNFAIQKISSTGRSKASTLEKYISACFLWSDRYRNDALLWCLFFYYCGFRQEYRKVHTELVGMGHRRIVQIIEEGKGKGSFRCDDSHLAAKMIQTIITGALVTLGSEDLNFETGVFKAEIIKKCIEVAK